MEGVLHSSGRREKELLKSVSCYLSPNMNKQLNTGLWWHLNKQPCNIVQVIAKENGMKQ